MKPCRNTIGYLVAAAPAGSSPAAMQAVADATGAGLQADAARAVSLLRDIPAAEFRGPDKEFRSCMERRFGGSRWRPPAAKPSDPFARRVLFAYQVYWRAALLRRDDRATAETALLATLRRLLGREDIAEMDALEPELANRLRKSGLYSLQGMTGPLRELMLW